VTRGSRNEDVIVALAFAFLLFVIIVGALFFTRAQNRSCAEKGGVYLSREGKCVRGIEEVR